MQKRLRRFLKPTVDWFAKIQLVKYPLFLILGDTSFDVRGAEIRHIVHTMRSGDILLRRQAKGLTTRVIPGYFSHAGIVETDSTVIHAVGQGVVRDDILDYLRTDAICILRPDSKYAEKCVQLAQDAVGKPYDYIFDSDDKRAFYCSELAMHCLPDVVPERQQVRDKVPPDDLVDVEGLSVKFDSRVWRKTQEK